MMKKRKKTTGIILCSLVSLMAMSACAADNQPKAKVDISISGRPDAEVLEPGFTKWPGQMGHRGKGLTLDGVSFSLESNGSIETGWSKAFIQSDRESCRLTADGVTAVKSLSLVISGLPKGTHRLQTFHNYWQERPSAGQAIQVFCNDAPVGEVQATVRQTEPTDCGMTCFEFTVNKDSEDVVIRFESEGLHNPVVLNGFLLNYPALKNQASHPCPANFDYHADADGGFIQLSWKAASDKVKKHILYFGTDSAAVAAGKQACAELAETSYEVKDVDNLHTYFWRVDEVGEKGEITQGEVWMFRPRHLAFEGAEGYGRFANGGRGGKVVYVTNLNDDGPGSFRAAATSGDDPRTILFKVSGLIHLKNRLVVDKNVTIAGQSAPGKGICFRSAPMGLRDDDICRFIRVRLGAGQTADGLGMGGVNNGIIDHCSIGWSIDEAFSSRNARNITLQHTLISEALSIAGHKVYPKGFDHGYAGSISGDAGSFHHNLLAHNSGRNWSLAGGLDGDGQFKGHLDIFNMVVYNWNVHSCYNGAREVNFVNNYYKPGPATLQNNATRIMLDADEPNSRTNTQRYYFAGNVMEGVFDENNQEAGRHPNGERQAFFDQNFYKQWVDEPFFPSYAKIESARDAYKSVTSDVGCNMPVTDDHDLRVIDEVLNGTYHYVGSVSGNYGLIDSEADCGGYEDYGSEQWSDDYDSDLDGLPDWWENLYGSNPKSAAGDFSDANADSDHDGYTVLENFLEWMCHPHFEIAEAGQITLDLQPYFAGYAKGGQISAESSDANAGKMEINQQSLTFKAAEDYHGITHLKLQWTDAEGSLGNKTIGICVK